MERARVAPTSYGRTGPGEVGAFAKIFRIHMSGKEAFRFGEFSLDIAERQLKHGVETLHLSPKALDVLIVLVREQTWLRQLSGGYGDARHEIP